jgi:hypothetical protein
VGCAGRGREGAPEQGQVVARGGFVQRHGHALAAQQAHIGAGVQRALHHGAGGVTTPQVHGQGVEGGGVQRREAQLLQACRQDGGEARHALGDALEPFGAVVHGVHAGDDGGQHLRGADVGGGLLAADVLLARLQRQAVGRLAMHVHAHAHQAAGHGALEVVAAGHVGGVRAARAHGHAKALRGADHDVGAHFAGVLSSVRASRSAARISAAPLAWMMSALICQSASQPLEPGYWLMAAK